MKKILTIFKRDFENKGMITKELAVQFPIGFATEKLDGTNVRLTVRNHQLIRVEKRRNPDKIQKHRGITDPWYVDASEFEAQDKHIYAAARNTDLSQIPDGEWSGEAVGTKIQGNPINLPEPTVFLFSHEPTLSKYAFEDAPEDYDGLRDWLPKQKSKFGTGSIEGLVWWVDGKPITKIKLKDFRK